MGREKQRRHWKKEGDQRAHVLQLPLIWEEVGHTRVHGGPQVTGHVWPHAHHLEPGAGLAREAVHTWHLHGLCVQGAQGLFVGLHCPGQDVEGLLGRGQEAQLVSMGGGCGG